LLVPANLVSSLVLTQNYHRSQSSCPVTTRPHTTHHLNTNDHHSITQSPDILKQKPTPTTQQPLPLGYAINDSIQHLLLSCDEVINSRLVTTDGKARTYYNDFVGDNLKLGHFIRLSNKLY
jgi:hypothetical protein